MTWDTNVVGLPTANYVVSQNSIDGYTSVNVIWSGSVTAGYNFVNISPPVFYQRGSMLYMYAPGGGIGVDTASSSGYQDFIWTTVQFLAPSSNLLANVITQSATTSGQATRTNTFTHTYSSPGSYNLNAHFECNSSIYLNTAVIGGE